MKMHVSKLLPYATPRFSEYSNSFIPREVVIPIMQTDDAVECSVAVGDRVQEGQVIASGKGLLGSVVHSPVPGTVVGINNKLMPNGRRGKSITIRFQGEFSLFGKSLAKNDWEVMTPAALIRLISDNGIINTFHKPAVLSCQLEKFSRSDSRNNSPKTLVVRCSDEDPGCTLDLFLFEQKMPEILEGIEVLAKAAQATRVIVLIPKRFKPSGDLSSTPIKELVKKSFFKEASPKVASKMEGPTEQGEISSLEETLEQGVHVAEIAVEELPVSSMEYNSENQTKESVLKQFVIFDDTVYPSGGKRDIINVVKKKKNIQPSLQGDELFVDASTAFAVYEGVVYNKPFVDKYIQVSGRALAGQGIIKVRLGTPLRYLVAELGGVTRPLKKILINGVLRGTNVLDWDIPVTKYVKSVIFSAENEYFSSSLEECVQCGRCRTVCPVGLYPDLLYKKYSQNLDLDPVYIETASMCTGCALCNAVCSSRLPLHQCINFLTRNKL